MSAYTFTNKEGREVRYGLDKPTGGYFYNEFYTDEEIESSDFNDEVKSFSEALTFTELEKVLTTQYGFYMSDSITLKLVTDWIHEPWPTPLQYNINNMFGKNLETMLLRVQEDLKNLAQVVTEVR